MGPKLRVFEQNWDLFSNKSFKITSCTHNFYDKIQALHNLFEISPVGLAKHKILYIRTDYLFKPLFRGLEELKTSTSVGN